jgi:hypothetical protein
MTVLKWGQEQLVNTSTAGLQLTPDVAALNDGGFVAVWWDLSAGAAADRVRGQIYNADGSLRGGEFTVPLNTNTFSYSESRDPAVAALADGGFVVSYSAINSSSDTDPVFARYSANGVLQGTAITVDQSFDLAGDTAVTRVGSGFAVAWHDGDQNQGDIRLTLYNSTGGVLAQVPQVNNTILSGDQFDPVVTQLTGGRIVVAWANGTTDVRARVFDSNGAPITNEFFVGSLGDFGSFDGKISVTALNNNGFVVVWEQPGPTFLDTTGAFPDNQGSSVRGQIFSSSGAPFGSQFVINTQTIGYQFLPDVTPLVNGGFLAIWTDAPFSSGDQKGQAFDMFGNRDGSEFTVNPITSGDQSFSAVATLSDGRVVAVFEHDSVLFADTSSGAIGLQILDPRDGLVNGTASSDTLYGHNVFADELNGLGGNDILIGLGGNDVVYGGDGVDAAFYSGPRASYFIGHNFDSSIMVADLRPGSPEGADQLNNIEVLQFSDVRMSTAGAHDFSRDFNDDILWQNDNGQAAIWLMNGTSIAAIVGVNGNPGPTWHVKDGGDFNLDGKADILWQNDNGQLAIWLMNGTTPLIQSAVGGNLGPTWHAKAAADFNGDGASDILWQNDNGQAATWLMGGINVAAEGLAGANPGPTWHVIDAGDFSADGRADILWQNDNGQASIWLMSGGFPFMQSAVGGNLGPTWHAKAAADFNGDGAADILWQNDNGQAAIWLMNGFTVAAEGLAGGNPGADWHIKNAEDFNGDGKADILWQNDNGAPAIWLLDGLSVLGTTGLANPGADWHVI